MKPSIFTLTTLMIVGCASKPSAPSLGQFNEANQTIDRVGVLNEIRSHVDQVKGCYEAELKEKPKLAGRILIFFEIADNGSVSKVSNIELSSTLHDQKMIACLIKHMRTWTFPRPPKDSTAEVLFPFTFSYKD